MIDLMTESEFELISAYNIPAEKLFNASGLRGERLKEAMRESDSWIAFGATPCKQGNHTVRLRTGHCLGCKPEGLNYFKRHYALAFVYLAYSNTSNIYKIGSSKNPKKRILELNNERYGGSGNWTLVALKECENAGMLESLIHRLMKINKFNDSYFHSSEGLVNSRELFKLNAEDLEIVNSFLK